MRAHRALVVGICVGVAACGGGGGGESGEKKSKPTRADDDVASVEQVASTVARTHGDLLEQLAAYEDARLDQITFGTCGPGTCQLTILTLGTVAKTMDVEVGGIDEEIPAELEDLVAETLDAVAVVSADADAYLACIRSDPSQFTCGLFDLNISTVMLENALQSWAPYL